MNTIWDALSDIPEHEEVTISRKDFVALISAYREVSDVVFSSFDDCSIMNNLNETDSMVDRIESDYCGITRQDVIDMFERDVLPEINKHYGEKDIPARRAAWSQFTDSLCKDGTITLYQNNSWEGPY
jgi:hypothetical protein